MIGLSFKKWNYSRFYRVLGGYVIAKRYYYKAQWTPIVFFRWNNYNTEDKITWADIKQVCTSLDNLFYGSLVVATVGILYWLWQVMGIWLFIAPVFYVFISYLGMYVKQYIHGK